MRSIGAASRQAARARERRERAVAKGLDKADRFQASFDGEAEREMQRVKRHEAAVREHPISSLKLMYDAETGWTTSPFGDQTGRITYDLQVKLPTYGVTFEPPSVQIDGLTVEPLAFSAADYSTFVAFKLSAAIDANLKLVNRSRPDQSRVAIATPSGAVMYPTESSLDGRIFGGTWKVGVVAFAPFQSPVGSCDLIVSGAGKRAGASVRLRVSGSGMAEHMATCLAEPTITAGFESLLRSKQAEVRQMVDETKLSVQKTGSGCLVVLLASTLLLGGLTAVASTVR